MAVNLRLHMERKNDYNLILFLDKRGRAEVGKEELLRSARADAASFLMDYADLTAGYAGRITAEVLGAGEIQRAQAAYAIYKDTGTYPSGYREALFRARRIVPSKGACTMVVEQCVDAADRPRCASSKR